MKKRKGYAIMNSNEYDIDNITFVKSKSHTKGWEGQDIVPVEIIFNPLELPHAQEPQLTEAKVVEILQKFGDWCAKISPDMMCHQFSYTDIQTFLKCNTDIAKQLTAPKRED